MGAARARPYGLGRTALVGYRLTGDSGLADRVLELVLANLGEEWNEMLWGPSGSLLAAEAMLAWTGEERWAAAWDTLADRLEASRDADGLWTQHRLGDVRYYGVGHGYAGNQLALSHRREVDVDSVLSRIALRDGSLANRTGDELWLDRARAFGVHAIGQVEREREKLGHGRYSLFTGDLGVALFLRHLLDGEHGFPALGPFAPRA